MTLGYDIFRKLDDGSSLWIADVASLNEAKEKIELLLFSRSSSAYFIRAASSGNVVFSIPTRRLASPNLVLRIRW
jgi:hypothetical protein